MGDSNSAYSWAGQTNLKKIFILILFTVGCGGFGEGNSDGGGGSSILLGAAAVLIGGVLVGKDSADLLAGGVSSSGFLTVRTFGGPNQFKPNKYGAYAIIAFTAQPTDGNRDRFTYICDAFFAKMLSYRFSTADKRNQLLTVWPMNNPLAADQSNYLRNSNACEIAVDDYGYTQGLAAINAASKSGMNLSGQGPFIIGWSPGGNALSAKSNILVGDLSLVNSYEMAERAFDFWSTDIQTTPSTWKNGWNLESIRRKLQQLSDNFGNIPLQVFGVK